MHQKPRTSRRHLLLAAAALIPSATATPAWAGWFGRSRTVEGNGVLRTEVRPLAGVRGVSMSLPGRLEVRLGDRDELSIHTDENLLPLVATVVDKGELKIRTSERGINMRTRTLNIVLTVRSLERIALNGSGTLVAEALEAPRFQLDSSGSGRIDLKGLRTDFLALTVSGSGAVKVGGGRAQRVTAHVAGSGGADLRELAANTAEVSITGSGNVTLAVRDRLNAELTGSGEVAYLGDPQIKKTVVGSGGVRKLGPFPA